MQIKGCASPKKGGYPAIRTVSSGVSTTAARDLPRNTLLHLKDFTEIPDPTYKFPELDGVVLNDQGKVVAV